MKVQQKSAVSEKNLRTSSEDLPRPRKIPSSPHPLLQKNLNFLQTYNKVFQQPLFEQIGDADNYFKKSLRNEPFDLIRDLKLNKKRILKSARSLECITKRKPRSKQTLPSLSRATDKSSKPPFEAPPAKRDEFQEIFTSKLNANQESESEEEEDSDSKEFATPKLTEELEQIGEEASEGESTPKVEQIEELKESEKMAEDEKTADIAEGEDAIGTTSEPPTEDEFPSDIETEDDEMKEVKKMIDAASEELQQVVEENAMIMNVLGEGEGEGEGEESQKAAGEPVGDDGSVFKYDAAIDNAVLKELEAAEMQAKETAKVICDLRNRVAQLLKKEKMTEVEAKELEEKNRLLKQQMQLFEEKIKRIQFLIAQTNLFESMVPPCGVLQTKHAEDVLPKVIVCGLTENNMPKIIVCNDRKRRPRCMTRQDSPKQSPSQSPRQPPFQMEGVSPRTEIANKLNECICMQEKLVAENADLEGMRYQLQSDVFNKDQAVDQLQKQLVGLQNEMRVICQENVMLNEKLKSQSTTPCGPSRSPTRSSTRGTCGGKNRGICPADVETRLKEYSKNTEMLELHLGEMECEIKTIQNELCSVQREREHLEHHRKMLCPPPCFPPCAMPPCMPPPCLPPCKPGIEQQLRELREQYNRLQDDFKSKLIEVSSLRAENEKLKETTKAAEQAKKQCEDKVKELEAEIKKYKSSGKKSTGSREQLVELEQQLIVAKQRFREAQDELEELRALVEDQKEQLSDYRNKYLEAQQFVEEQRRQIDLMEIENQRVSEQVNLDIQRVKNQFQEKLQELMPLPDILKATQLKLQEAQQMHLLAERNNEAIARELKMYKDKVAALTAEIDGARGDQQSGSDEKMSLQQKLQDLQEKLEISEAEKEEMRSELEELKEKYEEAERLAEERLHEITQLESQLESVREESARQIARVKDRCEIVRKSMQNQICDLERQMAQSKAIAKAAQKDRDDIRCKMQAQINNLNENFEDAQMRIRSLQGHVNFLKNTYGDVQPQKETPPLPAACLPSKNLPDPCCCGSQY